MAFCGNCGNQVQDGLKFCTHCGAPMEAEQGQGIPVPNVQQQQPIQPQVQFAGGGMPPQQQKSDKGLIAIVAVAAAAVVLVVLAVILFVYPGVLTKSGDDGAATQDTQVSSSEEKSNEKSEDKKEESSSSSSEGEKSSSKEETSSSQAEAAQKKSSSSSAEKAEASTKPDVSALEPTGQPTRDDFLWLTTFVNEGVTPSSYVEDTSELVGSWKGYIAGDVTTSTVYDGVERLFNVDITDNNGQMTMTINWYQFVAEGNIMDDSAGSQTYTATVTDGDTNIFFNSGYETVDMYSFFYDGGSERCVGVFTFTDGTKSYFALTRP